MIKDANVWRVILHNSAMNDEGNYIKDNSKLEQIILDYYKKYNVVAIGWGLDEDNSIINSFDDYRKKADAKYKENGGYKRSVLHFGDGSIKTNDLIWTRCNNTYYISKVSAKSKWQYKGDAEAKKLDTCNQITNIDWREVTDAELLQQLRNIGIPNQFIQDAFQIIKDTSRIEFSKKAYNKTFGQQFYEVKNMDDDLSKINVLLTRNKNIILQGAPGTGKTYKTAELALQVIGAIDNNVLPHSEILKLYDEYVNKGQIEFVTFHQSMDYEDFVEGLKPELITNSDDENVGINYSVKPGVFKRICDAARSNTQRNSKTENDNATNFENAWNILIEKLNDDANIEVSLLSNENKNFVLFLNKTGSGLCSKPSNSSESNYTNYYSREQLFNVYCGLKGVPTGGHDNYRKAIIQYMKDNCSLSDFQSTESSSKLNKYVLIIDEINRGNVSKIFGELISLIEKDKREPIDEDKSSDSSHPLFATLPYSKDRFSVPSNLYIIGTMNTTDRSVGSLDYALRRRFSFYTIKSDENLIKNETARKLFNAVKSFLQEKDNILEMDIDDLMVGHSYFMVDKDDEGDELEERWKYEIKPLLMEYYKDGIIQKNVSKLDSVDGDVDVNTFIGKFNCSATGNSNDQNNDEQHNSNVATTESSSQGDQK